MNNAEGSIVITSSTFDKNLASAGPAIFSHENGQVINAGLNCASENRILGQSPEECNGVQTRSNCVTSFDGACASSTE